MKRLIKSASDDLSDKLNESIDTLKDDFDYILSSRYAYCNDNLQASWGMQAIEYGEITTDYLCHSLGEGTVEGGSETYNRGIRPVVTINSNVTIYGGNGTEEYPYQLSK